jgi:hypothetical protein
VVLLAQLSVGILVDTFGWLTVRGELLGPSALAQFDGEPRLGVPCHAVGRARYDTKGGGRFIPGQAGEVPQFEELRVIRFGLGEFREGVVEGDDLRVGQWGGDVRQLDEDDELLDEEELLLLDEDESWHGQT